MRALLLLVLTACGAGYYPDPGQTADVTPLVQKLECASGGHGSMFPVQRAGKYTVFATAKHVTDACSRFSNAVFLKHHDTADVALVIVPGRYRVFRLAQPLLGQSVRSYGFPGEPGTGFHVTDGIVAGRMLNGLVRITAPIWFGFSGGPVLNVYGQVVCMNTATFPLLDGFSGCTESSYIKELLD